MGIIIPIVNNCLWEQQLDMQANFMTGFVGYASYLNLRYFAIKWTIENSAKIVELFKHQDVLLMIIMQVMKELKKSVPNLIIIVETSGDAD